MELTRSEMEIMDVLWNDGGALSRSDFLERSEGIQGVYKEVV